jgi:hypothetical protein
MPLSRLAICVQNLPPGQSLPRQDELHLYDLKVGLFGWWTGGVMGIPMKPISYTRLPDRLEVYLEIERPTLCEVRLSGHQEGWAATDWAVMEPGGSTQITVIWDECTFPPSLNTDDIRQYLEKTRKGRARYEEVLRSNIEKLNLFAALKGRVYRKPRPDLPNLLLVNARRSDAATLTLNADIPIVINSGVHIGEDWQVVPIPAGPWDVALWHVDRVVWTKNIELRTGEIVDLGRIELPDDSEVYGP